MKATELLLLGAGGVLLALGGPGAAGAGSGGLMQLAAAAPTCPAGQHAITEFDSSTCVPNTPTPTRTVTITNKAALLIRADIGTINGNATIAGYYGQKANLPVEQSYTLQVPQNVTVWVEADYWNTSHSDWESVPQCRNQVGPGASSITFTASGTSGGGSGTSLTMTCKLN